MHRSGWAVVLENQTVSFDVACAAGTQAHIGAIFLIAVNGVICPLFSPLPPDKP